MRAIVRLFAVALLASSLGAAHGAPASRDPWIGYLFPAGGQRGTTLLVQAGGQNLRGPVSVHVSGEGIAARVVRHIPPMPQLEPEQARAIGQMLRQAAERIVSGRTSGPAAGRREDRPGAPGRGAAKEKGKGRGKGKEGAAAPEEPAEPPVELPDHPLLKKIDQLNLRELKKVTEEFFDPVQRANRRGPVSERVEIEVTVAPDATPGDREIRIVTRGGVTNPLRFVVGFAPEYVEDEPNDFESSRLPSNPVPVVLNGQITWKDVDRFRFRAKRGQSLVVAAEARKLVPYIADAVPGWFQAVIALRDAKGREIGYGDDWRFDPDPVLFCTVPEDGEYELVVRDSIYRGREDFVYRITVGEVPFVTRIYPLGGRAGEEAVAALDGLNLPRGELSLDTRPEGGPIREAIWLTASGVTNRVTYAVGDLPETFEAEPNDAFGTAQPLSPPVVVNGRIAAEGDLDYFSFRGMAGDEVVAEVHARRLGSPLDSLVRITDGGGRILAFNDDCEDRAAGLVTHHADSLLRFRLPADGTYCVQLADAQAHGGPEYAYRLRISPPRPDFAVILDPSAVNVMAGGIATLTATAVRRDGFAGAIDLTVAGGHEGFALSGGRIPAGVDRVRLTLMAPADPPRGPVSLRFEARAEIAGEVARRPVSPAEDQMQAFGYRHLVPTREFVALVMGQRRGGPLPALESAGPVRLAPGGIATVAVRGNDLRSLAGVALELFEPPPGISIRDVGIRQGGVVLVLAAAPDAKPGTAGNLIVEAYAAAPPRAGAKKAAQSDRAYLGTLPAIPFEIR
ncbi:MAG: hypothetical protein MUE73_01525 [Planctomycetes bacterium]|jgi:hypothetical protein|nr:hypothetical protein [Planctomycetota bacterium]